MDAVKEQLMPFLQRQKVQSMLDGLRKAAKVEVLIPLTEEKPAAAPATIESVEPTAVEPAKLDAAPVETTAPATLENAPAPTAEPAK